MLRTWFVFGEQRGELDESFVGTIEYWENPETLGAAFLAGGSPIIHSSAIEKTDKSFVQALKNLQVIIFDLEILSSQFFDFG